MIVFQTDLINNNPAYNDSIIRFSSTLTGMTKSDVYVSSQVFSIYPYQNVFTFNFKDVVKTIINQNGFKDSILPSLTGSTFIYDDPTLQTIITPTINVYNNLTGETTSKSYLFTKKVEQLPFYNQKLQVNNNVIICLPTANNFDYDVTYFDGYPFDFAVQGLASGDTFYFKNSNTGISSQTYTATTNELKRIFLSDGANNTTLDNALMLTTQVNQLELYVNGTHKANININKEQSKCGVYLKWFNSFGAYSYWLFEPFYKESTKTKQIEEINGKWDNLQNITSTSENVGKTSSKTLAIQSNFKANQKDYVVDLIDSVKVEMYIHEQPFIQQNEFNFIGVQTSDGTFGFTNKGTNNKLAITVELPAKNTITY